MTFYPFKLKNRHLGRLLSGLVGDLSFDMK